MAFLAMLAAVLVAASFPAAAACLILGGSSVELVLAGAALGLGLGAKLSTACVGAVRSSGPTSFQSLGWSVTPLGNYWLLATVPHPRTAGCV